VPLGKVEQSPKLQTDATKLMTVHDSIVTWSKSRPRWQQDALRRLLKGKVNSRDIEEIAAIARREYGGTALPESEPPSPADDPIPETGKQRDDVVLVRLSHLTHVNALQTDQELGIAATGLTVVFGENGAGKTGYVKVLKQVCRARGGPDAIYSNVYVDDHVPSAAKIEFEVNGVRLSCDWSAGVESPVQLREISTFDSRSASVYVNEESSVAYLPFGMDLFPRLSQFSDRVRLLLEQDLSQLKENDDPWTEFPTDTVAHRSLQRLNVAGARAACERLAVLSDSEIARLEELRTLDRKFRTDEPAGRATALRQTVARIVDSAQRWKFVSSRLNLAALKEMQLAETNLTAAKTAAKVAADKAFIGDIVPGIGTDPWFFLWRAARTFVETNSDPIGPFPPQLDQPCVLCLQPLEQEAADRLRRFDEYVKSRLQQAVNNASDAVARHRALITETTPLEIVPSVFLHELRTLDSVAADALESSGQHLQLVKERVLESKLGEALAIGVGDPLPALRTLVNRISAEAKVFENAADINERKALESELRELDARANLGQAFDRIDAQITRENKRRILIDAISSTNTSSITRVSRELLAELVTAPLAEAFERQRVSFRLQHIPIVLCTPIRETDWVSSFEPIHGCSAAPGGTRPAI
jgi:hypothetical protein